MMDGPGPGCDGKISTSNIMHQIKRKKLTAVAPPAAAKVILKKVRHRAACICACCVARRLTDLLACTLLTFLSFSAAGRVPDRPTQGGVSRTRG